MHTSILTTSFSRRSLVRTLSISILLAVLVAGYIVYMQRLGLPLSRYDALGLAALILLCGLLQWRSQCRLLRALIGRTSHGSSSKPSRPAEDQEAEKTEQAMRANREKRLFMHLFSVLQREGRLMDFLQEDLSAYDDGQIGAAVRSIHEGCAKTLATYLDVQPVMSQQEGDTVDIAVDFDPTAIKLVGNVVGEPPFSGVLRHRGWQLRSFKLPELGDLPNPDIIAPAEVEVQ